VNLYVTQPGAIMALTMIHLQSNNSKIASQIQLPDTFYLLESARPNEVLLKVLCKNLIMWDSIECTNEWVQSQIPEIIRNVMFAKDKKSIEKLFSARINVHEIDQSFIAMLYTYILAGAIFSIGFKFAGTGDKCIFRILDLYIDSFKVVASEKVQANLFTGLNSNAIDRKTYDTFLSICSFSISMIMAGTGDEECFKYLRIFRKKIEKSEMNYGYNMAIHMSIGFLFLGSGKYTFSRSKLSIASLMLSLYPYFPNSIDDNRHHLQALRHFYVLAIESRLVQTIDVDSGNLV
jgi:anaphase-promoting complex subunit 1